MAGVEVEGGNFTVDKNSSAAVDEANFTYITEGVILTIVSSFGLVGNIMSIFVLMRVAVQGSFSNLLKGLACFDALFLLTAILAFGLPKLWSWYETNLFAYIMAMSFGLLHTFRVGSVFVTLAVNFERFHAIVFPLRHFGLKKYLLPVSVIFAIVYNLPKYFEVEIGMDPVKNETTILSTALRRHPVYMSLYVFWSKLILIELIPYFTIVVCNVFIIVKITKSKKFRKRFNTQRISRGDRARANTGEGGNSRGLLRGEDRATSKKTFLRKQKEEHNLGVILIAMSTLFIICQSIKIIPDLYELIWCKQRDANGECQMNPAMVMIMRLSHLLVCINSSANFLMYYLNGNKFREAWLETYGWCLCCCFKKKSTESWNKNGAEHMPDDTTMTKRCQRSPPTASPKNSDRSSCKEERLALTSLKVDVHNNGKVVTEVAD